MLLSKYFLPVLKEQPQESQVVSHSLMLKSGMIKQQSAGIYSWLPLGFKVLKNIENIVRFNMNAVDCIELLMPCVQPADLWIESGRLGAYGKNLLRFTDRHDKPMLFGPTNEELITDIFRSYIQSYKDLPKNLYHIQWKFRDEVRPRFGVMRGREFLMKDAYSFDIDKESAIKTYNYMYVAYIRTFRDLGLTAIPVVAENGEMGGSLSHEFHIVADTGESTLYYDRKFDLLGEDLAENIEELKSLYAVSDEKYVPEECALHKDELRVSKGIEVGHIFYMGNKYSKSMNALVNNRDGKLVPVEMCSYGIGISRLAAAIIEANHDDKGIIWPTSIAPFKVSILNLNINDGKCSELSNNVYNHFKQLNIDILFDDTDDRPGSKFATHDLIGSPWQVRVGTRNAADNKIEIKHRRSGEIAVMEVDNAINTIIGDLDVK